MSIENMTREYLILKPEMNIIYTEVSPNTFIDESGINPGACILAIIKTGDTFSLIHAMPGSIVRELTALFLQLPPGEKMVLFFTNTRGNIQKLYDYTKGVQNGTSIHGEILIRPNKTKKAKNLIKRRFYLRDRTSSNYY